MFLLAAASLPHPPPWSPGPLVLPFPTHPQRGQEVFLKHQADLGFPLLRTPPWLPSAFARNPRFLNTAFQALLVWLLSSSRLMPPCLIPLLKPSGLHTT